MRVLFFVESSVETAFLEQTKESHDLQAFSSAISGRGSKNLHNMYVATACHFFVRCASSLIEV